MFRICTASFVLGALAGNQADSAVHVATQAAANAVSVEASLVEAHMGPQRTHKFTERKKAFKVSSSARPVISAPVSRHDVAKAEGKTAGAHKVKSASLVLGNTWTAGDWGPCQANCGTGLRYRPVTCQDPSSSTVDNSQCDSSSKPSATQTCTGDCLSCDVNAQFLTGVGASFATTPVTPTRTPIDKGSVMCPVSGAYTCCSPSNEAQLLIAHWQMKRGMTAQAQHRDTNKGLLDEVYTNVTTVLSDRIDATNNALDTIAAAIDSQTGDTTQDAANLQQLRDALTATLNQRTDSLPVALTDIGTAQSELLEQLDLMDSQPGDDVDETDTTSSSDSQSVSSLIASSVDGWFSSDDAQAQHEASFDDSLLNPSTASAFLHKDIHDSAATHQVRASSFLNQKTVTTIHYDPRDGGNGVRHSKTPTASFVQASGTDSSNLTDPSVRVVSKSCQTAINSFFIQLSCAACNPQFPVQARPAPAMPLAAVPASTCNALYNGCSDSLVAAHQHMADAVGALLNSHANLITLIAQVQPILDRVWTELRFDWLPGFSAVQVAKPDLTRMTCVQDLKVFQPYTVVNSTDFCNAYFQFISPKAFVKRIGTQLDRGLFALGKFSSCDKCLHETLMFLADVLGPTSRGSLRVTLPSRAQAMLSSCGPANATSANSAPRQLSASDRNSPRVKFGLPNDQPSGKGLLYYSNVSAEIVDSGSGAPPHEWTNRRLVLDDNVTMRIIPSSDNGLKSAGPDATLLLHIMNLNCSSHTECYHQDAPSGVRPWWFCAHPTVCTEQPGSCSDTGSALLDSGPKCARGPCTSDNSAVDRQCPDNAICPSQSASLATQPVPYFGKDYFAKFDLKIRTNDPILANTSRGVCDCAFDAQGTVVDQCGFARCLAYASLQENTLTCNSGLKAQCSAIKKGNANCAKDVTLDCDNTDVILTYPPDMPGECSLNPVALSDDVGGVEEMMTKTTTLLLVVGVLTVLW